MGGPWWFAGVVGLAGIVLGAILKWVFDTLSERRKAKLEVSSRFIASKKEIYDDFLTLIDEAANSRINAETNQAILDGSPTILGRFVAPTLEEQDEMRSFISSQKEAALSATRKARARLKAMEVISPSSIYKLAYKCWSPLLNGMRSEFERAEQEFLMAVRQDLGVPSDEFVKLLTRHTRQTYSAAADSNPEAGWIMILGTNVPWPSPPNRNYPLSIAMRRRASQRLWGDPHLMTRPDGWWGTCT